jgi:hypothetical protein
MQKQPKSKSTFLKVFHRGYSAMHLAVLLGHREASYFFIQEGAGREKSNDGFTPFLLLRDEKIISDFLLFGDDIVRKERN